MTRLHLGLTPWDFSRARAREFCEQARFAESCGYESFWLPEFHFGADALPDPMLILASIAAQTETIRLATSSYLLPVRNPLLAAEQVALLDQLSDGRVILGVGRGFSKETLHAFDIQPSTKRQVFEWCLGVMRDAWRGDPVSLHEDGSSAVTVRPLPVQSPHPPIWVAAFGPKALNQAGRLGLPYLASPIETFDMLASNYQIFDQAITDAGQAQPPERPLMRSIYLSENAATLKAVREQLARSKPPRGLETAPNIDDWAIVGDSIFVRDQVTRYREELNPTHLVVTRLRISDFEGTDFKTSIEKIAEAVA